MARQNPWARGTTTHRLIALDVPSGTRTPLHRDIISDLLDVDSGRHRHRRGTRAHRHGRHLPGGRRLPRPAQPPPPLRGGSPNMAAPGRAEGAAAASVVVVLGLPCALSVSASPRRLSNVLKGEFEPPRPPNNFPIRYRYPTSSPPPPRGRRSRRPAASRRERRLRRSDSARPATRHDLHEHGRIMTTASPADRFIRGRP